MSRFHIGQEVVCIKRNWLTKVPRRIIRPEFGKVYTVRAHCPVADVPCILLKEIHNENVIFVRSFLKGEASFSERFFMPKPDFREMFKLDEVIKPKEPVS